MALRRSGAGATGLQVFVEPEAGETPVLHAIEGAQRSVWVEVYLLTDRNVINALEDAANRGVDVRVLLELNPVWQRLDQSTANASRAPGGWGESGGR